MDAFNRQERGVDAASAQDGRSIRPSLLFAKG
jgi:hypothetical protein